MKKIATVTIYDKYNFGNRLQAYALQKYLLINNYLSEEIVVKETINDKIKSIIKYIINYKGYRKKILKNKYFDEFGKNIKINEIRNASNKLNNYYDSFIVGSDQVWNPSFKKNDLFFLEFIDNNKKNSYAASIGVSEISEEDKIKFEKLSKFKLLSVREENAKKIIEECTDRKDVQVLVDPTLLLSKEEWMEVEKKPRQHLENTQYILLYFLGNISNDRMKEINTFAKENNLEIIDVMNQDSKYYNIGPSEFIYLIHNAFLICTDSFHASVFSFIFNNPFVVFNREDNLKSMNARIENFIDTFVLENRRFNGKITKENLEHNYYKGYTILEKEQNKSEEFLKKICDE